MKSLLFFFHSCLIFSLSIGVPGYPLLSSPVSGYHLLLELDHECGPLMPMGRHLGRKIGSIKHCFNNTSYKSGTVETTLVLGDRDECVHDGFFLNNVIGSLVVIGVLQLVCFLAKQSLPKSGFHQ